MAAVNGPMPGVAQKQRPKYDPIALRQPREPELSGWKKFLRFFIHERVREVDRRDRWWGLFVWFLVVVAFGFYLIVIINQRIEQRKNPPVSVKVEYKPLTSQARVDILTSAPDGVPTKWAWDVHFMGYADDVEVNSSWCPTCVRFMDVSEKFSNMGVTLYLMEAFQGISEDTKEAAVVISSSLSYRGNTSNIDTILGNLSMDLQVELRYSCVEDLNNEGAFFSKCDHMNIFCDFGLQSVPVPIHTNHQTNLQSELHKVIELPELWHLPSSLPRRRPSSPDDRRETWSYKLTEIANPDFQKPLGHGVMYAADILIDLPREVITYEEQEPFDILTLFGVAAGAWGSFVFVISLLLPMRPSGRRRIWRCCWRPSARVLHQENKRWDAKQKNDIQQEMDGDIEEEMREVENQPGDVDIAVLELPSMEDRMARTERVLRRLLNIKKPSRSRKLKVRRLSQLRR